MALITFYDIQTFNEAAKTTAITTEMSWLKNRSGRLAFPLPVSSYVSKKSFLKVGSIVSAYVEGFPLWIGFVEPPKKWGDGVISMHCKSMEYIMHYRRQRFATSTGFLSDPLTIQGTAGSLVSQILQIANSKVNTGISLGSVYQGGINRQETLNDLLDSHLTGIANRTECVWFVNGTNNNGHLDMKLHFIEDKPIFVDYLLEEGYNLETASTTDYLVEDGEVHNDVLGTGDEQIDTASAAYIAQDVDAISENGLRQTIQTFMGNVELATITKNANSYLQEHKQPLVSINPVLPYSAEMAAKLSIGYVFPFRLYSAGFMPDGSIGFNGQLPVQSITLMENAGKISLVASGGI
jgi:hypothetical protein